MSIYYIDNKPHEMVAKARQAGPPFRDQDGDLIAIDYMGYDGNGMCNVRMTVEQAIALRDCLHRKLTDPTVTSVVIAKDADGVLAMEVNGQCEPDSDSRPRKTMAPLPSDPRFRRRAEERGWVGLPGMPLRMMMRRIEKGMTQADLGKLLNRDPGIVSRLELGKRRASLRDTIQIAEALECSLHWLATGEVET